MKTTVKLLMLAGVAVAGPLAAHHATTEFDHNKTVTVEGVVREFRWANPHAWLYVEVPGQTATRDQWAFEGASISSMLRNGWRSSSVKAGDRVRVLMAPRKDGSRAGEMLSVTMTDTGKVLKAGIL